MGILNNFCQHIGCDSDIANVLLDAAILAEIFSRK